ncbi:MAG: SH3 domain-containing protein, partial [bacterium]|nr:SH3 domain-containing protein [bacterium]
MIQNINRHLADILAERSLDWRSCYTNVVSQPPDGRTVVCECSDAAVLDELQARMEPLASDSGQLRYQALPGGPDAPAASLIASSSVADVRRAPSHASELVTQIVYGDAVEPLKDEGEWYLVRLDDGYIGWIRNWHLSDITVEKQNSYAVKAVHRVAVNHATVLQSPDADALPDGLEARRGRGLVRGRDRALYEGAGRGARRHGAGALPGAGRGGQPPPGPQGEPGDLSPVGPRDGRSQKGNRGPALTRPAVGLC